MTTAIEPLFVDVADGIEIEAERTLLREALFSALRCGVPVLPLIARTTPSNRDDGD